MDHLCVFYVLCVFVSCVSHDIASVHCCLVVTSWLLTATLLKQSYLYLYQKSVG